MTTDAAAVIDYCHTLMHLLHWRTKESPMQNPEGDRLWQVQATRGKHTVIGRAPTRSSAWWVACRTAVRLGRKR